MNRIIYIFIIYLLSMTYVVGQDIYIVRTDVDSSRYGFITATFTFTMDIYVQNVKNTNGVAFQLNYDKSNFVKFSQWQVGDYGEPQVVAFEDSAGFGRLIVAANRGLSPIPDSVATPKVLRLEFVTLQNSINNENITFEFFEPVATVIDTNGRGIVNLNSEPVIYNIHGFVNVWPGDTDNNGIVNHLDFAPVSQYVGFGSGTKNMKSFKRKSGSAVWGPHRVLTWDSAAVTYADCDGNGDITVLDMLIVTYNLGKDTTSHKINKINDKIQEKFPEPKIFSNSQTIRIPIRLNENIPLYAIAGTIDLHQFENYGKVLGLECGNLFDDSPFNYSIISNNKLNFALGSYNKQLSNLNNNIIGYLIIEPVNSGEIIPYIEEIKGITDFGNIINMNVMTSVENDYVIIKNESQNTIINKDIINFADTQESVSIIDLNGRLIDYYKNIQTINLQNLHNGLYLIIYQNIDKTGNLKYLKAE